MRLTLFAFVSLAAAVAAAPLPLTSKDVSLMLRSGYSSPSVMQELGNHHFVGTFDAEAEAALLKIGASPELITALKNGSYAPSPDEAKKLQQQVDKRADEKALAAYQASRSDARDQQQGAQRRSKPLAPMAGKHPVYQDVRGDLMRIKDGAFTKADDDGIADKKLIAIYFSAQWCGPCRKFTPELVSFYNKVAPQHPEFEIIFYSADRSDFAMQNYMKEDKMPWPAIDFNKRASKQKIAALAGPGIPCLVLIDNAGRVVSHSYDGTNYLGPKKVLADLESIFNGGAPATQVAQHQ